MAKLTKWLNWIDNNLVKILAAFFIFLIPLYPKFPFKFIDYTYISIRLEDLYVAALFFIFIVQLVRKKVRLNKKFLFIMDLILYAKNRIRNGKKNNIKLKGFLSI